MQRFPVVKCPRCGVMQRVTSGQTECFDTNCANPLDAPPPPPEKVPEQPPSSPPDPEPKREAPGDYQTPMGKDPYTVARRPGRSPSDGRGFRVVDGSGETVTDRLTEEEAGGLAAELNTQQGEAEGI